MNPHTPAAPAAGVFQIVIYSRRDCHLCDEAKAALARSTAGFPVQLTEIDVDGDAQLRERYGHQVPVVLLDGRKIFKFRVDETRLSRRLRRGA